MSNKIQKGILPNLKYDFPASIIVFLVAVPLCLGIALASGAPLFSGIIAGIVGGIVVGALSGSPLGVSGPAAGLTVIVLAAIQDLGFEAFLLAVALSGVFQIILGFLRAGVIAYYFPSSVIKGMLAAIGIIISIKQIPHIFGSAPIFENGLSSIFASISTGAFIITALSLGILILWEQKFFKENKYLKYIKGPLLVVILGIVLNFLFAGTSFALSPEQIVMIPVADNIMGFFNQFTLPDFSQIGNMDVYVAALTIAVVGSIETLLCMDATDKLDPFKRTTPANRELKAQGVGNLISGLLGGLPVVQVIVRGSTNIQSGGRTKMSAVYHGMLLLFCAMIIPQALNLIPLSCLAAILLMVGYKLSKPILYKEMYQKGWSHFVPFMATVAGIVFTDLLIGIGIGLAVAIAYILYNNYKKPFLFESDKHFKDGTIHLKLAEDVTFINKASIQSTLQQIPDGSKVIIDASQTLNIDHDVIEIIEHFENNAQERNIELQKINLTPTKVNNQVNQIEKAFAKNSQSNKVILKTA